ncbi:MULTISPECIES: hypothetical protein [Hyphomicrobiales]|jgi:hypothetical protein|uniref:hypothetical protein n=1 Tax=Xanthobacter autotrophicus TaxID=280 RepID=UPI003728D2BE
MSGKGKARPRKGQRVSFTREDGKAPAPRSNAVTGLRFTVNTVHGGTALIDLVELRPRRLALVFGAALREIAPTMVRTTVIQHVNGLKRFFRFLNETAAAVDGPEHLRAEQLDGFESWLEAQGVTTIHRHTILAKAIIALRTIDAGRPGLLDEKLRQRLSYTSARPLGRSTPRDAYSGYVAKQLRDAARADIQAITRRLKSPAPIEHADATLRGHLEAAAEVIEADGTISYKNPKLQAFYRRFHLLGLAAGTPIRDLHARRYLLAEDVIPFFVLLSLETGLEPECVKALRVDCLRNPASGTVEIEYVKRRARGSEWKRLRVRDGASSTPGGIIRTLIELTTPARKHKPSDSLWVYFHTGRLADRILHPQEMIDIWVARHGLVDDAGQPLPLLLSRLRKTHKALWYAKTQGEMARFAVGHTPEVAARHYADLPSLRHLHEQAIADGLNDALTSALQPRIVTLEEETVARKAPSTLQLSVPADQVRPILSSKQDVWLASCSGFHNSPFAADGEPCAEPFWGCLECRNAVITARKLPSIVAFLEFIVARRAEMAEADWWAKFGRPWSRITQQVLPAFSEAVVAEAREKAKALEHQPYMPLEARA